MAHIRDLTSRRFDPVTQHYDERDTILYALGLGIGQAPDDPDQLRHVYGPELVTLPAQAAVLANPGFWMSEPDTGIHWQRLVAGGHAIELHRPLPARGTVTSHTRVSRVYDRGEAKGAVILWERDLLEEASGQGPLATIRSVAFARGDGGFGGERWPGPRPRWQPDRAADLHVDWQTHNAQGLIYRLSGDMNPLHADPAVARAAGFERPILHGLCTLGMACYLLAAHCCGSRASLKSIEARYTDVVYPGDLLHMQVWCQDTALHFRMWVPARGATVLDGGLATTWPGDA